MTERNLEPSENQQENVENQQENVENQQESVEVEDKESPKAGRKRYGENLTHFYNKQDEEEKVSLMNSIMESVSEKIEKIFKSSAGGDKSGDKGGDKGGKKLSYETIISFISKNKKLAIWSSGGIFLIILAVFIIPLIPLQIERSAGFAAFQQKKYTEAFERLDSYVSKRSNDHAAVYAAARAALFSGKIPYARKAIDSLYQNGSLPESSGIGYHYALLNLVQPQTAISALDATLQNDPTHVGARLLRGILLAQSNNIRRARDDFLQLVDLLQSNKDFPEIEFFYRYIQQSDYLQLHPSFPVHQQNHSSNRWLSVSRTLDGFINGLQISNSQAFVAEKLSPLTIANLYFAYMLLENNETAEAKAIIAGLQRNSNDLLAVQQLEAFLQVYEGDYSTAQETFANILQRQPEDAKTLNNNVVMHIVVNEKTLDIDGAVALYSNLPQTKNADTREWSNSAYFSLLAGDYAAAKTIIARLADEQNLPAQVKFNQALLSWADGNIANAEEQLLQISPEEIPSVQRYIVALYKKSGNLKKAIDLMGNMYQANKTDERAFIEWVNLLYDNGDLRWAFFELQKYVLNSPRNYEVHYWLGYIALLLEEEEVYQEQNQHLAQLQSSGDEQQYYHDALTGADLFRQEKIEAASAAYERAIENTQDFDQKYAYLIQWAQSYVEHNPEKVVAILRQYQEQYASGDLFALLAYALAQSNAMVASEYAQRAIDDGNSHIINLYAGGTLVKIGDFISGTPLLESASRQRPARANILTLLQQAYTDAGDSIQAERIKATLMYLEALLGSEPPTSKISYRIHLPQVKSIANKVRNALKRGVVSDADEVLAEYTAALSDEKYADQRAGILYSQATFEAYLKNYANAISLFEEALAVGFSDKKRQIDAMLFYAEVFSLEKQHQRAVNVLKQVIEIGGDSLLHQRLYAVALARAGEKEAAIALFNDILLKYPADLLTYQDFANIYFLETEYNSAISVVRQLTLVEPNYAPAYKLLAETYSLLGGNSEQSELYSAIYSSLDR